MDGARQTGEVLTRCARNATLMMKAWNIAHE